MGCGGSKPAEAVVTQQQQQQQQKAAAAPAEDAPASFPKKKEAKPEAAAPAPAPSASGQQSKTKKNDRQQMKNVFAKQLELADDYRPPVHPKTDDETTFITTALRKNFVFEQLAKTEMDSLVLAFERTTVGKDEMIIKQGDEGDYFYIIQRGTCAFIVNGNQVGQAGAGASFGELALLYTSPRAATVTALEDNTVLFRVDQTTFRFILQTESVSGDKKKQELLTSVPFFAELQPADIQKLTAVMVPKPFTKGDYLMRKGDEADFLYIVQEGIVTATDIVVGDTKYEDVQIKAGQCVGERALVTGDPRAASVIATTDGLAWGIDKTTFREVLGDLNELILRSQDQTRLQGIKVIKDTNLDQVTLNSLSTMIEEESYRAGQKIITEGQRTEAALYFVRANKERPPKVQITTKDGRRSDLVEGDGYFGDDLLLHDKKQGKNGPHDPSDCIAPYTVTVLEDTTVGILTLYDCRKVFDTLFLGEILEFQDPPVIDMRDLRRHALLGAGTFGQVWLVSRTKDDGSKEAYALKIQSKYEIIKEGVAKGVVMEKNIMKELRHPFIIQLVSSAKDKKFLYMVVSLVQGGELYNIIHKDEDNPGLPEKQAVFYTAGVAEGLAYMHRRGFAYRDLKPENVLIDKDGYPVIVDLGFCKKVKGKTYTLCGTPLYLAPEVILNKGHDWSCDHWSLGVLVFEMLTGDTPFYREGMNQSDIFKKIVSGRFEMPTDLSDGCVSLIRGFLVKDPPKRLGNMAGGERDIFEHGWMNDIDVNLLRRKGMKAPYVPNITDPLDSSNFDDWSGLEDKTAKKYPKLSPEEQKEFEGF